MNKEIKYVIPKTINELKNFQKLNYRIENEIWKPVTINSEFKISNYGRLFNCKTNKLRQCTGENSTLYSIRYMPNFKDPICDLMLYAFYPDISNTHINAIVKDGNIFNLFLDNIKYVPNSYYKDHGEYKEKYIYADGKKTQYTVDTNGIVKNQNTGRHLQHKSSGALDSMNLGVGSKVVSKHRQRIMAEAFIPNPHNLMYVALIGPSKLPFISNICWTNRKKLVKK